MKRDAHLSPCGTYRFTLVREWAAGPQVLYIGHNPSTADATVDDPTVRAWIDLARANGFGGFTAVNLYPFRSADVNACRSWARWDHHGDYTARDTLYDNASMIARLAKRAARVVACWGALAHDHVWVEHILESIQIEDDPPYPDIYCLGVTNAGEPKHPMARGKHRIPRDQPFLLWRKAA